MTIEVYQSAKGMPLDLQHFPYAPALVCDLAKPLLGICVIPNDPRGLGRYEAGSVRSLQQHSSG